MRRVPEVIDCWFDSGAMPFAQWGYPNQRGSRGHLADQFPADFISEALDQTRGWFYSLLAISTLLFSDEDGGDGRSDRRSETESEESAPPLPKVEAELASRLAREEEEFASRLAREEAEIEALRHSESRRDSPTWQGVRAFAESTTPAVPYPHPFRNCVVLGLMLGEDGNKMSKSKRNYREPQEIFDRYGADALRWYFFANQPPWTSIRYSESAIRESIPEFLLRLWNVYSFFVIYANIDGFDPAAAIPGDAGQLGPETLASGDGYRPPADRAELDRWILSELHRTVAAVIGSNDAYDNFAACARLNEFVDALSNWYVRRSRDRFWSHGPSQQKSDAYWTLYGCLLTTAKLIAPFVPFLAEALWRNLAVAPFAGRTVESVHLCDYPTPDPAAVDEGLSERMAMVRETVSLGRSARMGAKLKVRQPLALVEVVLADASHQAWLEEHAQLIGEELNVKRVEFAAKGDQYITYSVLPDLKRLGPRLGRRLPALKNLLATTDPAELMKGLEADGKVVCMLDDEEVTLDADDLQVRLQAKEGWAAAQGRSAVVVLSTDLSPELIAEGLAREVVHSIQNQRKEMECEYTARIRVVAITPSRDLCEALGTFKKYVEHETLTIDLNCILLPDNVPDDRELVQSLTSLLDVTSGANRAEVKVAGHALVLYVKVAAGE